MDDRAKSTELVRHQTIQWLRLRQRSPSFATSSMLGKNMHERGYGDNVRSGTKSSMLQTPRQMSLSLMNNRQLSSATSKSTSNGLSISVNACSSAPPRNKLAVPAENNVTANRMSPEVEQKARMEAEKAIKTKKIFTIIGPYPTLRSALRQRGWVEKFQSSHRKSKSDRDEGETTETNENYSAPPEEDDEILKVMNAKLSLSGTFLENLLQDLRHFVFLSIDMTAWHDSGKFDASPVSTRLKSAKPSNTKSQVVRNCTPTLVFTVKAIDVGTHATRSSQMVNHFGRSSTFTTKAGLCQNLRNVPWFTLTDPDTFYPRCYNLSDPDDRETFTDDYRLTACTGFLVYFLKKCGIDLSAGHGSGGFGTQLTAHKKYGSKTKTYFAGLTTRMALEGVLSQEEMESKNQDAVDDSASDAAEVASVSNADTDGGPNDEDDESSSCVKESGETGSQSAKATRVRRVKVKQIPVIPLKALKIAIQQCRNFLKFKDNEDIDALTDKLEISDWQQFLSWYYSYIHNEMQMEEANGSLIGVCKDILQNMQRTCSQFDIDGYRDIWIMKPGAKSRGRGIQCLDKYEEIIAAVEGSECSFVVQKYIERPMLIYKTKFDIRQWFLVTDWNPLTFWFYSDCYLRFCSQEFTLENFHISVHLSNNSVQKHFSPSETRSRHVPEDNMWTSDEFQEYLKRNGYGRVWTEHIIPGMKQAIQCSLLCTQEHIECRKSAFELYGADFMLSEDMKPWLIEINSSPSMARNTHATEKLVDRVLDDMLKVVLDRKTDKMCDTGRFEMVYKQQPIADPPNSTVNLSIQGKKIRKKCFKK